MALNLSRKEQMLLEDQKKHEQICVQKYQSYANQTQTPQLKQLFTNYVQAEQQHLSTINQILRGQAPDVQQQGQQQNQQGSGQPAGAGSPAAPFAGGPNDAALLNDMLMTEKYVSGPMIQLFLSLPIQASDRFSIISKKKSRSMVKVCLSICNARSCTMFNSQSEEALLRALLFFDQQPKTSAQRSAVRSRYFQ